MSKKTEISEEIMEALKTGKCPDGMTEDDCDDVAPEITGDARCVECWRRSLANKKTTNGEVK
jgi:hypothetical protein